MGSFFIKKIENAEQKNLFYKEIFDDLEVFDQMLADGVLNPDNNMIAVSYTHLDVYKRQIMMTLNLLLSLQR